MKSGHSGGAMPRCQNSSGRTEGSSGRTTPGSCTERQPLLENGFSDPSRPWERQHKGGGNEVGREGTGKRKRYKCQSERKERERESKQERYKHGKRVMMMEMAREK